MDHNDLINTNRFTTRQPLNRQHLLNQTYQRVPTHQQPNTTRNFIQDGVYSRAPINQVKQKISQWPPADNKVTYPILSNQYRDIVDNRYSKYKVTNVSIDARDGIIPIRSTVDPSNNVVPGNSVNNNCANNNTNTTINPACAFLQTYNNFDIFLFNKFENVVSIKLTDVNMVNPLFPDKLTFGYPVQTDEFTDAIEMTNYSSMQWVDLEIEHTVNLKRGPYNTVKFLSHLEDQINGVLHDDNEKYNQGKPHQISVRLSTDQKVTYIVSRLEQFNCSVIYTAMSQADDFIGNLPGNTPLAASDIELYVYFILGAPSNDLPVPADELGNIIFVDAPSVGGISSDLINYVEYGTQTGNPPITTPPIPPFYQYVDDVSFTGVSGIRYKRFRMRVSIVDDSTDILNFTVTQPTHSEHYCNPTLISAFTGYPFKPFEIIPTVGAGLPIYLRN